MPRFRMGERVRFTAVVKKERGDSRTEFLRSDRNWQPKLATKAGKEWQRRLSELNPVKMSTRWAEIGIPERYWGDRYIYSPGLEFDTETKTLYIGWGTQYVQSEWDKSTGQFPSIEWQKVALSEWHAYLEAKAAREPATEASDD